MSLITARGRLSVGSADTSPERSVSILRLFADSPSSASRPFTGTSTDFRFFLFFGEGEGLAVDSASWSDGGSVAFLTFILGLCAFDAGLDCFFFLLDFGTEGSKESSISGKIEAGTWLYDCKAHNNVHI